MSLAILEQWSRLEPGGYQEAQARGKHLGSESPRRARAATLQPSSGVANRKIADRRFTVPLTNANHAL